MRGHSVRLDPLHNAVRPDLADIRLAEYVFAPHYAAPLPMSVVRPVALRAGPEKDAETLCTLEEGDAFEALDLASSVAWGTAPGHGLVGYVDPGALTADPDVFGREAAE